MDSTKQGVHIPLEVGQTKKKAIQKFISSKDNMLAKLEAFENFRDEDLKKYFKNIKKTCKLVQKTVTKLVEG